MPNSSRIRMSERQLSNLRRRDFIQRAIQHGIDTDLIKIKPTDDISRLPISYLRELAQDFLIIKHDAVILVKLKIGYIDYQMMI